MSDRELERINSTMSHLVDAGIELRGPCLERHEDHPLNMARHAIYAAQDALEAATRYVLETRVSVKTVNDSLHDDDSDAPSGAGDRRSTPATHPAHKPLTC